MLARQLMQVAGDWHPMLAEVRRFYKQLTVPRRFLPSLGLEENLHVAEPELSSNMPRHHHRA